MADTLEHALTLIARLHGGDPALAARTQAELSAWRGASKVNEAAYRDAHARWNSVGGAAAELRGTLAEPPKAAPRAKRLAKAGALLGLAMLAFAGARWHLQQPVLEQQLTAGPAQLARAQLPDGSSIEMAAASQLDVALYRDRRIVRLESGEARFDVARDASRPFIVQTRAGEVRVIGTAFTVRDRGAAVAVSVERGRVAFAAAELTAGERLAVVDGKAGAVERIAASRVAPWRSGWIVFDDVPLADALAEINAWRREPLRLADAPAGEQRLTGSFRADDPEGALQLLPQVLAVQIRRGPQGLEIGSRP